MGRTLLDSISFSSELFDEGLTDGIFPATVYLRYYARANHAIPIVDGSDAVPRYSGCAPQQRCAGAALGLRGPVRQTGRGARQSRALGLGKGEDSTCIRGAQVDSRKMKRVLYSKFVFGSLS